MYTEFWWGNLKEGDLFEYSFSWDDSVKMDLKEIGREGTDKYYYYYYYYLLTAMGCHPVAVVILNVYKI